MDSENKTTIIFWIIIILIIIGFFSSVNLDYDSCKVNNEIQNNYWENKTCFDGNKRKFQCEEINMTKVYNYCEIKYGGYWRWD